MALLPPPKGNGFLCHKNFMKSMILEEKIDSGNFPESILLIFF